MLALSRLSEFAQPRRPGPDDEVKERTSFMISIGTSDDVPPIEPAPGDDAAGGDDELAQLRAREHELRGAYLRDPWNVETQRALVRVQQKIRHLEESAQRMADNGPAKSPPHDAAEYARRGAPIRWAESLPPPPDTLDLVTPVDRFTDAEHVQRQIAMTEAAMALGQPQLQFHLGRLRTRLAELRTHDASPRAGSMPPTPLAPLGHGDCATPRPQARPGNAARVADAGIDLEAGLTNSALTTAELERYIDEYVAYTATRPELSALHSRAVARGPAILADRLEADEEARERAAMQPHVENQTRLMQVRPPIGVQQNLAISGLAITMAEAVRLVISIAPGEGQIIDAALSLMEALTGRSLGGLGQPIDTSAVERGLHVMFALAPYADKLLSAGAAAAAGIVRLARATGRTEAEVRALLVAARDTAKDRAALQEGLTLARAGRALTPQATHAMYRARQRATQLGAAMLGGPSAGVVRAQQAKNARHVERHIGQVASPSEPPPGYLVYAERGGQMRIRRRVPDDALYAPLTVDAKGRIQWGSAERLSKAGALAKALGAAPPNHQGHHVVPDAVVRDSPLFQEARRRGVPPYNVDGAGNGAHLPIDAASRIGATKTQPLHSGSHPLYSELAAKYAMDEERRLLQSYRSLSAVPGDELSRAARRVEVRMRGKLDTWTSTYGDSLR